MSEKVLCIPAAAIDWRGFGDDPALFEAMKSAFFVDRDAAEGDERVRQVIPYVVFRDGGRLFSYGRTRRGSEARLHDLRSVGVGGHVNPEDLPDDLEVLARFPRETLAQAARRELREETVGAADAPLEWIGFLCEDEPAVARVHFGVVYAAEVHADALRLSDEGKMADARFSGLDEIRAETDAYEGWSRRVIEALRR